MTEHTGMHAVDMALDAAVQVLQNGGSTIAVDRTFSNVLKGYKKEGVRAVWRLDFIAVSAGPEAGSSTVVRPVGPIGVNVWRATEAMRLAERLASAKMSVDDFPAELERIKKLDSPYHRLLLILAAACVSGSLSRIAGGDWGSLGIAFVAGGVGQALRSFLLSRKISGAPLMMICGVLSALIGCLGLRLGYSATDGATLIASVFYMVPGLPLINGFIDIMTHKYLFVGMQRMLNAAFLFLVLAVAIAFVDTLIL